LFAEKPNVSPPIFSCAGQRLFVQVNASRSPPTSASPSDLEPHTIRENPNKRLFDLDPSQKTLTPTDQLNPFD
jgi:hypothetical protein